MQTRAHLTTLLLVVTLAGGAGALTADGPGAPPPAQTLAPARTPAPPKTPAPTIAADCPGGYLSGDHPGDPVMCTQWDQPPPGVNVHAPVATAVLAVRDGASVAAITAANAAGVSSAAALAQGSNVVCEGDGVSGYRVEALYVVEAGKANRYAALNASFKRWAAGVEDVVNRSAAKTGGIRHVRFVTTGTAPSCTAAVKNVTVPAGSLASLDTQRTALRALGYNRKDRKYLMWTDANVLCGIGTRYADTGPAQDNRNNGYYAGYARVDTGCWGRSEAVEAHELTHNLGAVDEGAPHGTEYGHCTDEYDLMCYSDDPNSGYTTPVMVTVCPATQQALMDCKGDDYFSTAPAPGSWLATHWNVASSRFLIAGARTPPAAAAVTRISDLNRDGRTDLVARDSAGRLWLYPGNGTGGFLPRRLMASRGWGVFTAIVTPGDVTGDGNGDVLARNKAGALRLYPGNGRGGFTASRLIGARGWNAMTMISGAGLMSGDARPDVMARDSAGRLWLYPMVGRGTFQTRRLIGRSGWNAMTAIRGAGDLSGDAKADLLARDRAGKLWLYRGNGRGGFATRTLAGASGWAGMTALLTPGNWDRSSGNDLLARDGAGKLWLYPGNNAGRSWQRRQIGSGFKGYTIA